MPSLTGPDQPLAPLGPIADELSAPPATLERPLTLTPLAPRTDGVTPGGPNAAAPTMPAAPMTSAPPAPPVPGALSPAGSDRAVLDGLALGAALPVSSAGTPGAWGAGTPGAWAPFAAPTAPAAAGTPSPVSADPAAAPTDPTPSQAPDLPGSSTGSAAGSAGSGVALSLLFALLFSFAAFALQHYSRLRLPPAQWRRLAFVAVIERPG